MRSPRDRLLHEHRPRDHDAAVLPDVRHPGPLPRLFNDIFGCPRAGRWALSIICLTLVIRTALIPLFVKQIKNSRNLQLLQPKVKELQKKYGHDRERLTQETMKLYKETGTNPLASCLPLLLQMPIFLALFRTLNERGPRRRRRLPDRPAGASLSNDAIFGTY